MTIPKVEKAVLERTVQGAEVSIRSQPVGDLMHLWAIMLVRNDEPGVQDIVKLARGEWLYRIFRFSVFIRNPPVRMYLSVDTHHALREIKRGYLYPSGLMPHFETGLFESTFKATLTNYCHQLAVYTLPGDRVYMHLVGKQPFEGQLRILSYI